MVGAVRWCNSAFSRQEASQLHSRSFPSRRRAKRVRLGRAPAHGEACGAVVESPSVPFIHWASDELLSLLPSPMHRCHGMGGTRLRALRVARPQLHASPPQPSAGIDPREHRYWPGSGSHRRDARVACIAAEPSAGIDPREHRY